jgi:hypothetical protein
MSDATRVRYFVRNHQSQPVELHLVTGVLWLGPRGEGEIQRGDLEAPQLTVLRRNRLVSVREVAETLSQTAPEAAPGKPAGRPKPKHA